MQKAIFIDRDGVINIEKNYLYKIEEFEFINGVFEALKSFQSLGYTLFIITNQSGIGRGYYTLDDFNRLTSWMLQQFKEKGITISDVQLCPHGPNDDCNCRKPKTGMIDTILKKHAIDLQNSWLIGDKASDIECAKNAGIAHTIQVKSGHEFETSMAEYICDSIKEAKDIIRI